MLADGQDGAAGQASRGRLEQGPGPAPAAIMSGRTEPIGGRSAAARVLGASDRALMAVENTFLACAVGAMTVMMVIVSADAVGRYLFNSPLVIAYDTVMLYFLPGTLLLGLAYTFRRGGHILVEVVAVMIPTRLFHLLFGLGLLLSLVFLAVIVQRSFNTALESWRLSEVSFGVYTWIVWPSKALAPLGLGMLAIRVLHSALANLAAGATGDAALAYPGLNQAEELSEMNGAE